MLAINEPPMLNLNNLSQWYWHGCCFQLATLAKVANWSCQWISGCTICWEFLATNFVAKSCPNIWWLFGLFWKNVFLSKPLWPLFGASFWKIWAAFNPTSSHTARGWLLLLEIVIYQARSHGFRWYIFTLQPRPYNLNDYYLLERSRKSEMYLLQANV